MDRVVEQFLDARNAYNLQRQVLEHTYSYEELLKIKLDLETAGNLGNADVLVVAIKKYRAMHQCTLTEAHKKVNEDYDRLLVDHLMQFTTFDV